MKGLHVSESHSYLKEIGRPGVVSREQLLCAFKKYATTSETELAEKLNVGRTTIWRRLQEIPREKIDEVLQEIGETRLKSGQCDWKVFLECEANTRTGSEFLRRNQVFYIRRQNEDHCFIPCRLTPINFFVTTRNI